MFRAYDGARAPKASPPINMEVANGLVFWSDFREGGGDNVRNLVGGKHIGTTSNMETSDWGQDNLGSFLELDGVDEHVQMTTDFSSIIRSTSSPMTVCAMVYINNWPTTRDAIIAAKSTSGGSGFDLRLENGLTPTNAAVFSVGSWSSDAAYFPKADIDLTIPNFFAGRYDGTNLDIFVNGAKGTSDTSAGHGSITETLYIGVNFGDAFASRNFDGKIYDVRIYNRALSDGEIYALQAPRSRFDIYKQREINVTVPVAPTGRIMSSLARHGGLAGKGGIAGQGGGLAA